MTQQERVLEYLFVNESITEPIARTMRIGRLSDVILKLRRKGYNIETIMHTGVNEYGKYTYGEYKLNW